MFYMHAMMIGLIVVEWGCRQYANYITYLLACLRDSPRLHFLYFLFCVTFV